MDFYIAAICFPIIFLGELPDKTMFASLLLSTRGRPVQVWLGAAAAFTVHVAIAVLRGVSGDRASHVALVCFLFPPSRRRSLRNHL